MINNVNESSNPGYNAAASQKSSGGDKVAKYVQRLFSKNGISGEVELNQDSQGRISVANDHPQKSDIENLLNNDEKLAAMLNRPVPTDSDCQDAVTDEQGRYYTNSQGDSAFISDSAIDALSRQTPNYIRTIEAEDRSLEAYLRSDAWKEYTDSLKITDKDLELKVNYNWYSSKGEDRSTGFSGMQNGKGWYLNGLGENIPIRKGLSLWEDGKSAITQEKDVLNSASTSRKQVSDQLQTSMKNAGIELKQGQKVDFIMDEKGNVKVDPKSLNDKKLASQIESVINSDKTLGASLKDHLAKSVASDATDPASMKIHVDSVLREYTGAGFDELEWDSSGSLVAPEGMEALIDEYGGIGYVVGHLKALQESEGEDLFKKEFSFSVTASGVIDNDMSKRVSSNLFDTKKMYQNNSIYQGDPSSFSTKGTLASSKESIEDFWNQDALQKMFQTKGTAVYLTADGSSSFAVDAGGARQELPYKSENYNASAQYLIEDYFIENGIDGKVSDYALKVNSKGSYDVVRISDVKVK